MSPLALQSFHGMYNLLIGSVSAAFIRSHCKILNTDEPGKDESDPYSTSAAHCLYTDTHISFRKLKSSLYQLWSESFTTALTASSFLLRLFFRGCQTWVQKKQQTIPDLLLWEPDGFCYLLKNCPLLLFTHTFYPHKNNNCSCNKKFRKDYRWIPSLKIEMTYEVYG